MESIVLLLKEAADSAMITKDQYISVSAMRLSFNRFYIRCSRSKLGCPVGSSEEIQNPSLVIFVNRTASTSISLAFRPHRRASIVNATSGGWPSGSTVWFHSHALSRIAER